MSSFLGWQFSSFHPAIFLCRSEWINEYIRLREFFDYLLRFFQIAYPFGFFVMIPLFLYFSPKLFRISCIRLLDCFRTFFPYLLIFYYFEISCFVCIVSICFYSSLFCRYLLFYLFEFKFSCFLLFVSVSHIFLQSYHHFLLSYISYLCFQSKLPSLFNLSILVLQEKPYFFTIKFRTCID